MAGELGAKDIAAGRYNLPALQFNPLNPSSYFDRTLPKVVTDTSKLSKAQGFKSIMEALGQLPEKGMKLYAEGKRMKTDLDTRREYDKALKDPQSKDPSHAPLSDFRVSNGNVTLDREDPEIRELKISEAKARKSYWDARAAGNDPDTEANPLFGGDPKDKDALLDYDEKKPTTGNPIIDAIGRDVKKGGSRDESCWDWAQCVYKEAGAGEGEVIYNRHPTHEPVGELDYNRIEPGAWLWVHNGNKTDKHGEHSVLFMDWLDKEKGLARVASGSAGREPRIETYDFNKKEIRRVALPQYTGAKPEPGGLRKTVDPDADPAAAPTLAAASDGLKPVINGATVIEDNDVFRMEEKESNGYINRYTIPKRLPKGAKGKLAEYIKTERIKAEDKTPKQTPTENALDRAILMRGGDPTQMDAEMKTEFLQKSAPLKPSERIAATNQIADAYKNQPSTVLMFGTRESVGLDTVKAKLDALLAKAGGDYSKLSPTDQKTFVFNFSKFNDPGSAVLIQEYKAAADTLGILDQAGLALDKAIKGEQLTPEQAKMLHDTINTVYEKAKADYVINVAGYIEDMRELGASPRKASIPQKAEQWVKEALSNEEETGTSINRSETVKQPVKPAAPAAPAPKPANVIQALQQALQSGKNPDGTPMSDADRRAVEAALKLKSATQ